MSSVHKASTAFVASCLIALAAVAGPPSFTITADVVGNGTVLLDPNKSAYKRNNIVNVTAVPEEGWRFDHWEGDLAGDTNPTTIRVADNHVITAVFVDDGGGTDVRLDSGPDSEYEGECWRNTYLFDVFDIATGEFLGPK